MLFLVLGMGLEGEAMTDPLTPAQRSAHMARIRSGLRHNRFERGVHELLKGNYVRHRMYPDIEPSMDVLVDTRAGPLFVALDGCLWHACPDHYRRPKTNGEFWARHIEEQERARQARRAGADFPFVAVWEHLWRDPANRRAAVLGIIGAGIEKVESGAATRGPIEPTLEDLRAVWERWRK